MEACKSATKDDQVKSTAVFHSVSSDVLSNQPSSKKFCLKGKAVQPIMHAREEGDRKSPLSPLPNCAKAFIYVAAPRGPDLYISANSGAWMPGFLYLV